MAAFLAASYASIIENRAKLMILGLTRQLMTVERKDITIELRAPNKKARQKVKVSKFSTAPLFSVYVP